MTKIIGFETYDVRFPTSTMLDGSDAMNQDPDYSGAYLRLKTDGKQHGDSLVFTIGRGNDLQVKAIQMLAERYVGISIADARANIGEIARELSADSQLRWLGPDTGVLHMGAGAVLNALWDIFAKEAGVPLWKLLSDLTPEETVNAIDFRYISDALSKKDALEILKKAEGNKAKNEEHLRAQGLAAYTTTPGWLGYTDEKMLELTRQAVKDGFTLIKYKCGKSVEDDKRRLTKIRQELGPDFRIAVDANQVWDVDNAINWINQLKEFKLTWVEEPTHPDDVVGHAKIAQSIAPTPVATGEMAGSRIIFKQLLQLGAISVMQIDATRVAGVNENLANVLMAAKFGIPVCPHAGGVGLCEMVQHIAMWDSVAVSGPHDKRVIESVTHLHDHFLDPINVVNARYLAPTLPGGGAEMHQASIDTYSYPSGTYWKEASK
jgi:L-fuconate dehydratase